MLNHHGGTGSPDYGPYKVALPIRLVETGWFSTRSYTHLLLSGVFERFPKLRYIVTESGCAWVPAHAREPRHAVGAHAHRRGRRVPVRRRRAAARDAELLRQTQLLLRRELAVAARAGRPPRDRRRSPAAGAATTRTTRARIRTRASRCATPSAAWTAPEVRAMLGENAAKLYGFDLGAARAARRAVRTDTGRGRRPLRARRVPEGRAHDGVQQLRSATSRARTSAPRSG